jgi:glycosyltransferase involved in cell wall biosynthesis
MAFISIVVPAYNEATSLSSFFERLGASIAPLVHTFELIVVDDGSQDATWRTACATTLPRATVRGFRFSRNFGKEAAIAAGLDAARGDAAIVMDADLQHPPSLIPAMIEQWQNGAMVVQAVKSDRGHENVLYGLLSRIFYGVLGRLGVASIRNASDFCLLDARAVQQWRRFSETGLFFRGMSAWLGFDAVRLPFEVPPRLAGTSHWTRLSLVKYALRSITAFTSAPLQLVTVLGSIVLLMATVLGSRVVVLKVLGEVPIDGVTTIILLILLIGSSLMLALGIIGEYVARIYDEVKRRPRYIVVERFEEEAASAAGAARVHGANIATHRRE